MSFVAVCFLRPGVTGQLPLIFQFRKAPLPQRLIHAYRNCIGQIQAAQPAFHGQPQARIRMLQQQFFRQALVLPTKNQIRIVCINFFAVIMTPFGGKIIKRALIFGKKVFQSVIIADIQIVPVIRDLPA